MRYGTALVFVTVFGLAFCLVGCGGGDDEDQYYDGGQCDYSVIDASAHISVNPVWHYNARFNHDRTARWPYRDIFLGVFDQRIDLNQLQRLLDEINFFIYPSRLVILKNAPSYLDYDIEIHHTSNLIDNDAWCTWFVDSKSYIYKAIIEIDDFNNLGCRFYAMLKHELIHGVGFFGHTTDGGVMNSTAYNDVITSDVAETLFNLYSLPTDTMVAP